MQRSPIRGYEGGGVRGGLPRGLPAGTVSPPARGPVRQPVLHRPDAGRKPLPPASRKFYPKAPALGPLRLNGPTAWVLLFGALITTAFFGALVFRARDSVPNVHRPAAVEIRNEGPPEVGTPEVEGWDRLNRALARVPTEQVAGILWEANQWLGAQGSANCSVRAAKGQISIVLGSGHLSAQPLHAALARCADAVEHVMQ